MNAGTVISLARIKLNDAVGPDYRWGAPELLKYLDAGQREALSMRPDLRLNATGTLDAVTTPVAASTALILGDDWAQALASYVAFMALNCESEDASAGRAQATAMHYQVFQAKLGVRNG